MSTVLDLVVVFLVTHPLVALASRSQFFSHTGRIGLGGVHQIAKERQRKETSAISPSRSWHLPCPKSRCPLHWASWAQRWDECDDAEVLVGPPFGAVG